MKFITCHTNGRWCDGIIVNTLERPNKYDQSHVMHQMAVGWLAEMQSDPHVAVMAGEMLAILNLTSP